MLLWSIHDGIFSLFFHSITVFCHLPKMAWCELLDLVIKKKCLTALRINDTITDAPEFKFDHQVSYQKCFYNQHFSVPSFLVEKLLNTENGKVYDKLIRTCKYFYSKNRKLPTDRFSILRWEKEDSTPCHIKTWLTSSNSVSSNIWILKDVKIDLRIDAGILQKLISKIYRCDASMLIIHKGTLTETELDFFINPQKLKCFALMDVRVLDSDGLQLSITKIIEKMPNVEFLR